MERSKGFLRALAERLAVLTLTLIWGGLLLALLLATLQGVDPLTRPLLVMELCGEIGGGGEFPGMGSGLFSWLDLLDAVERSETVKALVLRIDSPGGSPAASQELFRAIRRLRDKGKTVVVSMGDICASGGYYVAAAAERIFANPSTMTGSIGVITEFPQVGSLGEKLGLGIVTIKSGRLKDVGSMFRPPATQEIALLEAMVGEVHRQFVADIAAGRGRDTAEIAAVADGRILLGTEALARGLVDELGGLREALAAARELSGLPDDEEAILVGNSPGWLASWLGTMAGRLTRAVCSRNPRLVF